MSLTATLETANSSLSTLGERASVVSRNVANANNDFVSRKIAQTSTAPGGGVRLAAITRATDAALFQKVLVANATVGAQQEIVNSLDTLNQTVADPEQDFSPAALVGKLSDQLQQYSAGPQDPIRAKAVLDAATDVANALNTATDTVQSVRSQADADIALSVSNVNNLLAQVQQVNTEIVKGTQLGRDVTDQLDTRDQLLTKISTEIGIRVVARANNDVAVYTDSGVTLFDVSARSVSFDATPIYTAGTIGNPLVVDAVAVTGPSASMAIGTGRLKGLTDIRDTIAPTYQSQLDEIARGLIETFSEQDQTASGLPDATGLFSYGGTPAVPATGAIATGIAGEISVNPAVNPDQGGNLNLIRDGGINGASYDYNPGGNAGFSARIFQLADGLSASRAFDPNAEAGSQDSVIDFSSTSVGWLQQLRQRASTDFTFKQTVQQRSTDSFTQETGVNLDNEMTLLLEIERSYQATSRLISAVDSMFQSLIQAV
jgi:flagellar hook-associated protein 1